MSCVGESGEPEPPGAEPRAVRVLRPGNPRITAPTLLILGAQDEFLGRELAQPSIDLCDNGRLAFVEEATHWVQHEEAERVNELVDASLRDGVKD